MRRKRANSLRIIGGVWRSRVIRFPDVPGLRPTPDRVRETLFNWLGQDLAGRRCLDLFAGSGALGFEALSRGAVEVTMVEQSRATCEALEASAAGLGARNLSIVRGDALEFLARNPSPYDLVFVDPPYHKGAREPVIARLPAWLAAQGLVYLEGESEFRGHPFFAVLKQGRAGEVHYCLLGRKEHDQSSVPGDI